MIEDLKLLTNVIKKKINNKNDKRDKNLDMGIVLTAVTTTIELIYGLQKLKLPQIIIAIMSFAIRYIDVFIDEFKRVRISMRSRGYQEKGIKGLIPIAYASGAMLIRGYERGERVYNSMISRGFKGTLELKEREFKSSKFDTRFLNTSLSSFCIPNSKSFL